MSEEPKGEPLSAKRLSALRSLHVPFADSDGGMCRFALCFRWPCDTAIWFATFNAERERADRAVELLREIVGKWGIRERIKADLVEALYLSDRCNDDDVITRSSFLARADKHRAELAQLDAVLGKEPSRG